MCKKIDMAVSNPAMEHKKLTITLGTYGNDTPACMTISHGTLKDAATISFERTLRVPDNQVVNNLPSSLGQFPLFSVADYQDRMPADMAKKGGIFLPMYQREAMWIKFSAKEPFALKIYVGGVNAISGVPIKEKPEAMMKRLQLSDKVKQDYVVLPDQPWLDGIASDDGRIRQFVAMPKGSGYSVEAQVTGEEKIDGMQFELTPIKRGCPASLNVKVFEGAYRYNPTPSKEKLLNLWEKGISDTSTILDLKRVIEEELGVAISDQRLSLVKPPNTGSTSDINNDQSMLGEIWIPESSTIEVHKYVPLATVSRARLCSAGAKMKEKSLPASMPQAACDYEESSEILSELATSSAAFAGAALEDCKDGLAMNSIYGAAPPPPAPVGMALPSAAPAMFKETALPALAKMAKCSSPTSGAMQNARRRSIKAPGQAAAPPIQVKAMSLAAGGLIKQSVNADTYPSSIWDAESTILFNVQLLNSESFMAVTGRAPPTTPIDAKTYQQHGYPFFDIWNEELSGVKGDFNKVKSVGEMDENLAKTKKDAFWGNLTSGGKENGQEKNEEFKRDEPLKFPVIMLDMSLTRTFKPLKEMEEEARKLKATTV